MAIEYKLYVLGDSHLSEALVERIRSVLLNALGGERFDLQLVNLEECPQIAEEKQILAIPTLVRESPPPRLKLIGDLSDISLVKSRLLTHATASISSSKDDT